MEESCGEGEGEEEEEGEEEDGDDMSQNSNSSKRQRRDSGSGRSSSCNIHINNRNYNTNGMPMELWTVYVDSETDVGLPLALGGVPDTACHGTPLPLALPLPGDNTNTATTARQRTASLISNMVTTSIAERAPSCSGSGGATTTTKERFEYKDWEEMKETLACASELCDRGLCPSYRRDVKIDIIIGDDPSGSIHLLRALIHQSHRFLLRFPDPSLFFSRPASQPSHSERSSSPDSVLMYEPTSSRRRRSITPDSDMSHSNLHHPFVLPPCPFHVYVSLTQLYQN